MPLSGFDPLVRNWFEARFPAGVTEPQRLGWPEIRAGRNVLISAPTGSGKTLAAFLTCIDTLVRRGREGALPDETEVVYVSPLKALSNDVHRNLEQPIAEMGAPLRAAVRTGDTPALERQRMARRPPHILVTTPESLFLLLTSDKAREMLRTVKTVIVDEIHALCGNKRGAHLSLTLARLEHLTGRKLQRIGLSATVKPLEEVALFLGGDPRIVRVARRREMDLAIEIPDDELGAVASNEMWAWIYNRLSELIHEHRTTLIFVNTRRLAERITHQIAARIGPDLALPHHGSLSRQLRLEAERRLKNGELRAVVATSSLELGIDIGSVELVAQIGSPRSIGTALQRIGRAGHWVGSIPKGRLFATTRDELIECAALARAIGRGELDRLEIPRNSLDILAQQITAAVAVQEWREQDLYELVKTVYSFATLTHKDYEDVVGMLSDGITTARGRSGAYLHRDQINGVLRARRGARLAAITSGGAIPESANYQVVAEPEGAVVGTLDEDFAVESLAGDVFLLGTSSWRIRRVEAGRVRVENAQGAAPTLPFWRGEGPGRTIELSSEVCRIREEIAAGGAGSLPCLDAAGASQAAAYIRAGEAMLGVVPTQKTIVAERFFDEAGGMQLVLHTPFGARINRAWGLALRKRFCRSFNFELQAAATDNGIVISLSDQHSFPLELVFRFLHADTVEEVLTQAMLDSPLFTARWRWNASRALTILRFGGGRKIAPPIQRMRSDDLLAAVFPDQAACAENLTGDIRIPDHPLVRETIANCLYEAMDLNGLKEVLRKIDSGEIRTVAVESVEPSPLSHEILNSNPYAYLDDAPLEERRARAVQLRRTLGTDLAGGVGALDAEAIAQVADEVWPAVRNADELHDALLTLVRLPPAPEWAAWFGELRAAGRAKEHRGFWVAAERGPVVDDAVSVLRGWLDSTGPETAGALSTRLGFSREEVDVALARLEVEGQVLRGRFSPGSPAGGEMEWCNRRVLARIHRLTIGRLRREIEPVSTAEFVRFLHCWQHFRPGSQMHGADGALQIIRQLQGFEAPAAAWEAEVLPRRIARYEPGLLDQLCLSGEVMWGRLSPHPAFLRAEPRRVRPTRVAPLAIFLREDAPWLMGRLGEPPVLSHTAQAALQALEQRGASFFTQLTQATGLLASEAEDGLWELVAAGLVTADGFANLRSLLHLEKRSARPRHAAGRWALLRTAEPAPDPEAFARQLLLRWGVVFRDLLARETLAPAWRDLLPILRRMETRGEVRGGRFVAGFTGEQFARPESIELLRAARRDETGGSTPEPRYGDPLYLEGVILPAALAAG